MPEPGTAPLRIALIGCGDWGRHVLRDLRRCGCRVPVVAPSDESRRRAAAGGAERIVERIADLDEPLDGAVIVTPARTHLEVIEVLLAHRPCLPIYCEKPLCVDPDDAARAARRWSTVYVMHKWRYHPGVLALAAVARRGELGPVQSLRIAREQWGTPRRDVDPVWTLLPHDLTIALEILGRIPEPHAARVDRLDGVPWGVTVLLGASPWVAITTSARSATPRREVQLFARDGVALLGDAYAREIRVLGRPPGAVTPPAPEARPIPGTMPLLAQIGAFCAFVRGTGPAPRGSLAEEAAIVRTVAAVGRLAGT